MNRGFVKSHGKPAFRGASFAGRRPVKAPTAAAPADPDAPQRLSKRMSELGLSSRREADAWIAAGWVKVNGVTAELGQKVTREDVITIDRRASAEQGERVTIPVHHRRGQELTVKCGYPQEGNCRFAWNKESGELTVELPERISARLFECR